MASTLVFFQCFHVPEGRKVDSLKQRVRSQPARYEMNKCTPLWRRTRLGVEGAKHTIFGQPLEVEMWKKGTPLQRESHLEVKCGRTHHTRTTVGSWREANLEAKSVKTHVVRTTIGGSDVEKVHAAVARTT